MKNQHIPVLLSEVLANLSPQTGESYLDLTAGFGGHAKSILDVTLNYKDSVLVDRDEFAVEFLKGKFQSQEITIMDTDFYSAVLQLIECGKTFDIILADFGVSSPQLDREDRGFSRVAAGFSSYDGEFRMPLVLAQGSPIFHSSCEGKLGIALE